MFKVRGYMVSAILVALLFSCAGMGSAPKPAPNVTPPNLNVVSSPDQAEQVLFVTIDMFRQIVLNAEVAHPDKIDQIHGVETNFKHAAAVAYAGIQIWRDTGNNAKYMSSTTEVYNQYAILGGQGNTLGGIR